MSSAKQQIGERILFYRKLKGLTQDQLGEQIGIDSKSISRIERGSISPSLDTLYKAASVLGIQVSQLFSEQDSVEINSLRLEAIELVMKADSEQLQAIIKSINKSNH